MKGLRITIDPKLCDYIRDLIDITKVDEEYFDEFIDSLYKFDCSILRAKYINRIENEIKTDKK